MVNKGKIPTKTEINILKKNEAKQKLESLNLDSNGSRPELHERLMIYYHGIDSVKKEKPNTIKGEFIKNIFVTSTMGISYRVRAK